MVQAEKGKEAIEAKQLAEARQAETQAIEKEKQAEQQMAEAQQKEVAEANQLQSETQIADQAVAGLDELQTKYDTLEDLKMMQSKKNLQKTSAEKDGIYSKTNSV